MLVRFIEIEFEGFENALFDIIP